MKTNITITAAMLLTALWLAAAPALAGPPTDYVKGILDEVMRIQNDPAQEATRKEAIRRIIQRNFDFDHMSRDSLGAAYDRLSASQRQEFQKVFSALFQDSYTRLVLNFLKRETVNYGKEDLQGDRARLATTLIRTNETIPVDYHMHKKGSGYLLFDVIVDGVSILNNYKTQFSQVISTKSFDFLMERMRTQYRAIQ
jgi:phospholipid transport system substrate-binding protein